MKSIASIVLLFLASCSEPISEQVDSRPLGTDVHVEAAMAVCGVDDWEWAEVFVFDGPPTDEPHLFYEIKSLPSEEVEVDVGRSWNRTERIERIDRCLENSFAEQGVRVPMMGAPLTVSCQGSSCDDFEHK